jgi:hypothetical protein
MFALSKNYLVSALLLFITEVVIAFFVHDTIVRPWGGDFLVVILLYCIVRGIFSLHAFTAGMVVLGFSYLIETLQYLQIVKWLGLEDNQLASIVMGTSFSWSDMLAYTLGIVFVLMIEKILTGFRKI